jgi:predicted phage terminase large subunit-like protein
MAKNEIKKIGDQINSHDIERCKQFYPFYVWYSHNYPDAILGEVPERWKFTRALVHVAKVVQSFIEKPSSGAYDILTISLPPQHGKSQTVTETLPSWYLGKWPEKRVILISYNDDTADPFMRKNKAKIKTLGAPIFGIEIGDIDKAQEFELTNRRGSMISRGIGSGITGRSADCLSPDTIITTECGEIKISSILDMKEPPRVLSYNHDCGILEWKKIVATRKVAAHDIVTIKTVAGREIKSTGDHRYYEPERGYKQAVLFASGDRLLSIGNVPNVRKEKKERKPSVPGMLRRPTASNGCSCLRPLWKTVRDKIIRGFKAGENNILLAGVRTKTPQREDGAEVRSLRRTHEARREVLFKGVFACRVGENEQGEKPQASRRRMPNVWKVFSASLKQDAVLFAGLREQSSFRQNEGRGQLKVQGRNELCGVVPQNETNNKGAGRKPLRVLWGARGNYKPLKPSNTSRGRKSTEQCAGEPDHNVRDVSHDTPQIECDTVSEIIRNGSCGDYVYDIQVEGNRNFFANGVLVHNCIIIDDPIKNREQAESEVERNKIWNEWTDTITTRLSAGGKIIVIATRWHEDDLIGRIFENEDQRHVTRLRLPCEAEENDPLGRAPGDALCPEFGKGNDWLQSVKYKFLHSINQNLGVGGMYSWNALYQGRPSSAEGNQIKRTWWKFYDKPPQWLDEQVQSWDCTFKDTAGTDSVAGQVWGRHGADYYLLDSVNEQLDIIGTMNAIRQMTEKWPKALCKYVEDKANGPAVIQMLRNKIHGMIAVNPAGNKVTRVNAILGAIEAGNVWLPQPDKAPWVNEFIEQCAAFPNGKHDDMVDAMSQGLNKLIYRTKTRDPAKKPKPPGNLDEYEARRIERIGKRHGKPKKAVFV